jgi:hypothetical protein
MGLSQLHLICIIEGDWEEKGSILGGNIIGQCEKKFKRTCVLILNSYRDRAVWIYKYKSIVTGNKERKITCC